MRSALTILGLVVVLTIVLLSAKKQMQAMKHPAPSTSASAPSAAASDGLPDPAAVGRRVEDLMKQGEPRAASEAD